MKNILKILTGAILVCGTGTAYANNIYFQNDYGWECVAASAWDEASNGEHNFGWICGEAGELITVDIGDTDGAYVAIRTEYGNMFDDSDYGAFAPSNLDDYSHVYLYEKDSTLDARYQFEYSLNGSDYLQFFGSDFTISSVRDNLSGVGIEDWGAQWFDASSHHVAPAPKAK